jgi:glycerol-3-phosphate dehydrogenase
MMDPRPRAPYDVAIIGGGVVGTAVARELSRYDLSVVLLERNAEVGFGTSKANSGIIHAGAHAPEGTLKGALEWPGNQGWGVLHDDLGFGFKRVGELVVAREEEQLATLDALFAQGTARGVTGLELWEPERIRAEEPNVSHDVIRALWAPTAGVINPYEAVLLLADNAAHNGVEIATGHKVTSIDSLDDGLLRVGTNLRDIVTRFVVNAAGVYSDDIAELAGVRTFSILPRKGEEYLLDKRLAGIVTRIIFPCPTAITKGILVIPTFDGTIMVGPTADDVDDKENLSTSSAGMDQVFEAASALVPGITKADVIASFAGLRPIADTNDFVIGPTARKGFINVGGIQSPGLTSAPAIAPMVAGILADEGLELRTRDDWEPSLPHPTRFAALSTDEQIRLAAEDPAFAHLVCRCEHVTEAEIVDAIDRGAHTLDGLKFRTRAGMGRCQGGFCTWRCMELLSSRRHIPMTELTKRGPGSWLVIERGDAAPAVGEPTLEVAGVEATP